MPKLNVSKRLQRAKEAEKALELRAQGATLQRAAIELGCSPGKVQNLVKTALQAIPADRAEALREQEGARLDWLWRQARENVLQSDPGPPRAVALGAALRVSERKAKLFGLDAPERAILKAEHTHKHSLEPTPEATAALVASELRSNPAFRAALAAEQARLDALQAAGELVQAPESTAESVPGAPTEADSAR